MKNKSLIIFWLLGMLLLASCGSASNANESTPNVVGTAADMASTMVAVQLTEVAAANPSATPAPTQTPAPAVSPTFPALQITPAPTQSTKTGVCLAADYVNDSIADGTVMTPGQPFTQTWILRNSGDCTWTENFAFVFHHGEELGANTTYIPLGGWVQPGEALAFTVNFIAPSSPGSHTSFWTLQSDEGAQFGPSPSGTVWVSINIGGPQPTSRPRDLAGSGYATRSDGSTHNELFVGDSHGNYGYETYITFNYGNLPVNAVVTSVFLNLSDGYLTQGNPFTDLGCMTVTEVNSGTVAWEFCSGSQLAGSNRYGSSTAVSVIQNTIPGGQVTFAVHFSKATDSDGVADTVQIKAPFISIDWYVP